jgi:nickel transport protein
MKKVVIYTLLAVLVFAGTASGHRMLMGYSVEELSLSVFYDDGTPAGGVAVRAYDGDDLIAEGSTDSRGVFTFRPEGRKVEDLLFVTSSVGHRAETRIGAAGVVAVEPEIPVAMKVAAGFGYLLGIAGISMIYASRKRR